MDNKIELKDKGLISKGQGQTSTLELSSLSLFKKDSYYAFVYKKTEKLATAIYMLTGYFSETEPVKMKLRQSALEMLSKGLLFSSHSSADRVSAILGFIAQSLECLSILELAKVAGLISSMNCEILVFEIESLVQVVEKNEAEILTSSHAVLTKDFFSLPADLLKERNKESLPSFSESIISKNIGGINSQVQFKEKNNTNQSSPKSFIKDTQGTMSDMVSNKIIVTKQDRGQQILSLMKKDIAMTIKDFTSTIRDCSEKTIQRELLSLVSRGVLKKEGERRWSRYSLR